MQEHLSSEVLPMNVLLHKRRNGQFILQEPPGTRAASRVTATCGLG
jgi:hypothetical protein